jgi:hypothetical protein
VSALLGFAPGAAFGDFASCVSQLRALSWLRTFAVALAVAVWHRRARLGDRVTDWTARLDVKESLVTVLYTQPLAVWIEVYTAPRAFRGDYYY